MRDVSVTTVLMIVILAIICETLLEGWILVVFHLETIVTSQEVEAHGLLKDEILECWKILVGFRKRNVMVWFVACLECDSKII